MNRKTVSWYCVMGFLLVWNFASSKEQVLGPHRSGLDPSQTPAKAQSLNNPYAGQSDAVAGQKLFNQHCGGCHGAKPGAKQKAADLHLPLVQKTSPGTLFWFLKHGNTKGGMPSWSSLTDRRLWQIVTYVEDLR